MKINKLEVPLTMISHDKFRVQAKYGLSEVRHSRMIFYVYLQSIAEVDQDTKRKVVLFNGRDVEGILGVKNSTVTRIVKDLKVNKLIEKVNPNVNKHHYYLNDI